MKQTIIFSNQDRDRTLFDYVHANQLHDHYEDIVSTLLGRDQTGIITHVDKLDDEKFNQCGRESSGCD